MSTRRLLQRASSSGADRVYRDITRDREQPPRVCRQELHVVVPAGQGRPSLMQADVFGAAELSLRVEAGTQNPELGAVDLWSPAAIPGTAGSPPGRKRRQPLWISDFRLPILDFRLGTGFNPKSPFPNPKSPFPNPKSRRGRPQEALFQRRQATGGLRLFRNNLPDSQCSAAVVSLAGLKDWSGSVAPRSENSVDTPHCKVLRSFPNAPCPICRAR